MSRLDRDHPAISELAKLKPHSLVIELVDGTERKMEVPKARNRWERIAKALDGMAWDHIECRDKDGNTIGVVQSEEEYRADDADDDDANFAKGVKLGANTAMEVMRTTQKEVRQMFQAQLDGQAHVMSLMTQAMHSVSDSYTLAMRVQAANAAQTEGGDEMSNMLKMAMGLQAMSRSTPAPVVTAPPANAKPANSKGGS